MNSDFADQKVGTKKVLVTGGAGFIGCNLIRFILRERPDWNVVNFDALTYAGNLASLQDVENHPSYSFVKGDITDADAVSEVMKDCWGVLHLAAESHVDRSILDPGPFLDTNVIGTKNMLSAAMHLGIKRFVQVSTDEVYGSLSMTEPAFTEQHQIEPNSPYSASKAAGDLLARAYWVTYQFPVVVTRCSNNYGAYQFPEKLIPLLINNALNDKKIPVYGDGMQVRDWIYVEDHCRGLVNALESGVAGEVYNMGGNSEMPNIALVKLVLKELGKPESLITYVKDRPGHDRRYAMDSNKIKAELNWEPEYNFEQAIKETINWFTSHTDWIQSVLAGDYRDYYEKQYGKR